MTRQEREAQLQLWMQRDFTRLVEAYKKSEGIPEGTMAPVGMLASQMIAAILDKEFERPG